PTPSSTTTSFLPTPLPLPHPHSFPTRRSSDLHSTAPKPNSSYPSTRGIVVPCESPASSPRPPSRCSPSGSATAWLRSPTSATTPDRKSTRLNFSHVSISYAVFCLKKKKKSKQP